MSTTGEEVPRADVAFQRELLLTISGITPYSRKLTRDRYAAEDLVQDTLLRALERHHQWQRGTNLAAWLRTIMRNRYFESCRTAKPFYVDDFSNDTALSFPREAEQPLQMELRETGQAIERLSSNFREVIEMAAFDGASYEDIASVLNIPVGTVRSRLSRARTALRTDLEGSRRRLPPRQFL